MNNIVLIGYRGAGKTTIGRVLAGRLARLFVDTDDVIAERAGKTIAAMFADHGEPAFRDMETEVIAESSARSNIILSAGGGAVLRDENVRSLRACGAVFWLDADAETLWERIQNDPETATSRPALTDASGPEEVKSLLTKREAHYERCAHHRIDVAARTPDQIADEIESLWSPGR